MDTQIAQKLEELFNKMQLSQAERALVVESIGIEVARNMDRMLTKIMVEEDYQKLEQIEDEEEANAYIRQRFIEETGEEPQKVSDELTREYVEQLQVGGMKELLQQQSSD